MMYFPEWLSQLASWLEHGWHISIFTKSIIFLLLIWFAHLAVRRRQVRWRVYIWRFAAMILFLLPLLAGLDWFFVIKTPVTQSESPLSEVSANTLPPAIEVPLETPVAIQDASEVDRTSESGASNSVDPAPSSLESPDSSPTEIESSLSPGSILIGVWLTGSFLLLLRLTFGWFLTRRMVKASLPVAEEVIEAAQRISDNWDIKSPYIVRSTDSLTTPVLCWAGKPVLLIPQAILEQSDTSEIEVILAHELAHLRSQDLFWNLLIQLAQVVYWPNPLVWRMRAVHLAACELEADASSARSCGSSDDYVRTLARVALAVSERSSMTGLAMARKCDVRQRIERLPRTLAETPLRRRLLVLTTACGSLLALAIGTIQVVHAVEAENARLEFAQELGYMDVKIGDAYGEAIDGVEFTPVNSRKRMKYEQLDEVTYRVPLPAKSEFTGTFYFRAKAPDYVPMIASWQSVQSNPMPASFTLLLDKGTEIGGVVQNDKGELVSDATVTFVIPNTGERPRVNINDYSVQTDDEGHWSCGIMPASIEGIWIKVSHPDYPTQSNSRQPNIPNMRSGTAMLTLKHGYEVSGRITAPDGQPVVNAKVAKGLSPYQFDDSWSITTTDADGRYAFPVVKPGELVLTVMAEGLSPGMLKMNLGRDIASADIQLKAGNTVRIKVIDPEGQPIHNALIAPGEWNEERTLFGENIARNWTNKEGIWEWSWAPEEPVYYSILKQGYMGMRNVAISPSPDLQVFQFKAQLDIHGKVVDSETGELIPLFEIFKGRYFGPNNNVSWDKYFSQNAVDGEFKLVVDEPSENGYIVKVEAEGYYTSESRVIKDDEGQVEVEIRMQKGNAISGTILLPDGSPAHNAQVFLATNQAGVTVRNGFVTYANAPQVLTTVEGKFEFPAMEEMYVVVVIHDAGSVRIVKKDFKNASDIVLKPWSELQGSLEINGKPLVNERVGMYEYAPPIGVGYMTWDYSAETDDEGSFEMNRIAPGTYLIRRSYEVGDRSWFSSWPAKVVHIRPSESIIAEVSGEGRPLIGKVDWSQIKGDFKWDKFASQISPPVYPIRSSELVTYPANATKEERDEIWQAFRVSAEGAKWQLERVKRFPIIVQPDGAFRVGGVPPGEYEMTLKAVTPESTSLKKTILGELTHSFTMPSAEGDLKRTPFDLGELIMKPVSSTALVE